MGCVSSKKEKDVKLVNNIRAVPIERKKEDSPVVVIESP